MNKLTEWLTNPFLEEDINIPVNVGDTILVGKFKNKKMVIKDIGKDKHGMPTINGRKATTFRIHKTVNIFDEDNIDEGKKEFVIWGIPPGKKHEDILYTKAKSHSEAKKIIKILTKKHGVTKARIQVLDMAQDPKDIWKADDLFEGKNDPGIFKAVFLAGGPGSGKSYVAGGLFGIPDKLTTSAYGLKLVNQDTELEMFLKKYFGTTDLDNMPDDLFRQITDPSYSAHMGVRTHAKALSKQRLKLYSQGRLGVIIDGTGHKYKDVKKERQKLIDLGYDTYMVFVNTSLEVAQKRNKLRDRVLPEEIVEKYWKNVQKNMAFFQGLFGNQNFMLVDNNSTLSPKQAQKKFNMLVKKGIGKFIKRPIKNKQAKKWIEKQKITTEMLNPPNYLDNQAPTPVNSPEDENLVNRGKRKKKTGQPKFGTFRKESIGLSAGGGVINGAPSVKKVNKVKKQLDKKRKDDEYRKVDECIAIAKKFGDDIVLGKNRDRNYNPNLKVIRELTGYGVELCYVVDHDTDWTEGMNSEGIGLVNSALFVKRDEKDFDKAKKKKAMSKDGVRIREALSKTTLKDAVESLITFHGGIKGHTLISDGNKLVEIENTSRVNPKVKIHDLKQPVVKTNHGIYHPEQGYNKGSDRHSSVVRLNNSLEILTKEKDYKKVFPAFYNHKQDEGPKFDLVRAQNKLWTSSQLMMNLNKREMTLYLIPGAVKFLGIENTLPNDYESKIKLKVRQYEHSPWDKYDTYITTDKAEKKSAIKDTGVTVEKLEKGLDLYSKNVVYSISEKGDFTSNVIEDKPKIKKVVGVYGGRFQPFGPHHLKTYEWLKKQVDVAYITTSDIKQPPRHPMNFKEKVRHMSKMGVPKNRIIKERTPYVAKNTLKKFDEETTAVIYIFGEKDADRLTGGAYFQDYKKNKNNMVGHREHGYILTAPHVSMRVGGVEVSGTSMRELLGSPEHEKDRERRFKKFFGYYDKGVFNMMTNKFSKLYEVYDNFLINNPDIIPKLLKEVANSGMFPTDDGPPTFYDGFEDYKRVTKTWIENMYSHEQINDTGWDLLSYIISDSAKDPGLDYTTAKNIVPAVAYGKKGTGAYGERFGRTNPIEAYKDRIKFIMSSLGWEVLNWNGITPDGKNYTGVEVEAPVSAGVDEEEVGQNTERAKNLDLSPMDKFHGDKIPDEDEGQYKDLEENLDLNEYVNLLVTDKQYNGKELLLMGGAYGHMNHPFDDKSLTFGDLKNIITLGLGGKLSREDNVTEKLDGQNLMISWKDGKLVTARNKGQLKNFGANSMDASGVASKFAGRGDIRDAFVFAMKDLGKSIGRLSDAQKEKIFGNGKNWMNLEVIYPASSNVINYDKAEIVFHGALEYDESGKAIGELKGSGRMLAGMIKQVNQHIQKHYKIGKPQFLQVSKVQDFGKKKTGFISRLNKLQKEYALNDNDTLSKYHQSFWEEFIFNSSKQHKAKIPNKVLINLTKRWAFFDKSYKISQIKKDLSKSPDFLDWVLSFDKNDHQKWVKDNMKPFEVLFFDVGAEILKNISGYLAVSGDKAVQKIRKDVIAAIKQVKRGKDVKKLATLKHQLEKLEAIGGLSSIVPSEGIVFKYKGNTYKFTGAFAPVNQILGLLNF